MDVIKSIAGKLGLSYAFGTWKEVEYELNRQKEYPILVELLPVRGTFILKYESVKDSPEVTLLFMDIDQKTTDSEKTSEIVERMKLKALDFIRAINEMGDYETIDETTLEYYTIVKPTAKCTSGIEISLKLTPVIAVCL